MFFNCMKCETYVLSCILPREMRPILFSSVLRRKSISPYPMVSRRFSDGSRLLGTLQSELHWLSSSHLRVVKMFERNSLVCSVSSLRDEITAESLKGARMVVFGGPRDRFTASEVRDTHYSKLTHTHSHTTYTSTHTHLHTHPHRLCMLFAVHST